MSNSLYNTESELKALKTILTPASPFAGKLYGLLRENCFHNKATRQLYKRLQTVVDGGIASFPTWEFFITDSGLEAGVQAALKDSFGDIPIVGSDGDMQSLVKELQDLAGKRAVYRFIHETQETLLDETKSVREAVSKITGALTTVDTQDSANNEMIMGGEYNTLSEKIYQDVVYKPGTFQYIRTGYPTFDTRSGGHQRGNLVIVGANSGGGKCQAYQGLIPTTEGLRHIGDLYQFQGSGWKPLEVGIITRLGLRYSDAIYKGYGKTKIIRTECGDEFDALGDHKLLVFDAVSGCESYKSIDEIVEGDLLVKAVGTRLFGKYSLSDDLAFLLGMIVSEGTRANSISNTDKELLARLHKVLLENFGEDHKYSDVCIYLGKKSKLFASKHCGEGLSHERFVPKIIMEANEETQCSFLRSLYEGDGSVYKRSEGHGTFKNRWHIEYATKSKRLAFEIKGLLENIGIFLSVRNKIVQLPSGKGEIEAFYLYVLPQSAKLFASKIGFISKRKNQELGTYIEHLSSLEDRHVPNFYIHGFANLVPAGLLLSKYSKRVKEIADSTDYSYTQLKRVIKGGLQGFLKQVNRNLIFKWHKNTEVVTNRFVVDRILNVHRGTELEAAIEQDSILCELRKQISQLISYSWVTVTAVEEGREQEVFDLSVPEVNEYAANGLMSHNSLFSLNLLARQYLLGYNVVMASYEMNLHEIFVRLLSMISEVDMNRIQLKQLTVSETRKVECAWREFNIAGKKNRNWFKILTPTGETTVSEVCARYAQDKPTCIIFDYINLLTTNSKHADSQWQALGEIAKEAKQQAVELNCVVYLLAQIDDQYNLRYAKAIKDHANWVMGWIRDEQSIIDGYVTVKQMKARNAPVYDFQLITRFDIATFRDIGEQDRSVVYTEADYNRLQDESLKWGVMPALEESGTISPILEEPPKSLLETALEGVESVDVDYAEVKRPDEGRSYFNAEEFDDSEMS